MNLDYQNVTQRIESLKLKREKCLTVSIVDYLFYCGDIKVTKKGDRWVCLSPITKESNPSFVIYPENKFWDFSSGTGGNIIDLVMIIHQISFVDALEHLEHMIDTGEIDVTAFDKNIENKKKRYGKFDLLSYSASAEDSALIYSYAESRGFKRGSYLFSAYKEPTSFQDENLRDKTLLINRAGVGFPHTNHFGEVCGLKIRAINSEANPRFNLRGAPGFYVLENIFDDKADPSVYIVESETSASAFARFLYDNQVNSVVISKGGVNDIPKSLPYKYEYLSKRFLIIDYDGDNRLWDSRISKFEHLNACPIKIATSKETDLAIMSKDGTIEKYLK